jgi:hypothetical protein
MRIEILERALTSYLQSIAKRDPSVAQTPVVRAIAEGHGDSTSLLYLQPKAFAEGTKLLVQLLKILANVGQ